MGLKYCQMFWQFQTYFVKVHKCQSHRNLHEQFTLQDHQRAIDNFFKVIKPGGILIIDHRNYDFILDHGYASQKNIYYNVSIQNPFILIIISNTVLVYVEDVIFCHFMYIVS